MLSNQLKNQHLLWRAGFGPAAEELDQLKELTPQKVFQNLKKASSDKPAFLDATDDYLKGLMAQMREDGVKRKQLDREDRQNIIRQTRQAIKGLNLMWLNEMVGSKAQLREKASLFWHGHFAVRNMNAFHQQQLLGVIREHALGSFRDLLYGVSKSAAMLNFLNANQNRKGHPNENFAREVMELFTLGRGNYTENDIKEAARAFTGWGANFQGEFTFRKFQHDTGSKTVLGKTGNFTGEQVLDILLEQKQTARFLVQKLYKFYVNENEADKEKIEWLTNRFYGSNYNIGGLLEDIFTAPWFYSEKNIGSKVKSPVELIAGIRRTIPMKIEKEETQLLVQRLLGQVLFYPPNVAGWPGGRSWIDSSTLMMRMRLPMLFNDSDELTLRPKMDDDNMMGMMEEGGGKKKAARNMGAAGRLIAADLNWTSLVKAFEKTSRESLTTGLMETLLQAKPSYPAEIIRNYADSSSRENFIKSAALRVMCTPEYQMC